MWRPWNADSVPNTVLLTSHCASRAQYLFFAFNPVSLNENQVIRLVNVDVFRSSAETTPGAKDKH